LVDRGLALAKALAAAPDAPINSPLVDVDLVDLAPELSPAEEGYHFPDTGACFRAWLDGRDYQPTAEEEAEAAEIFGAMSARDYLDRSDRLTLLELVARQAEFYRQWETEVGDLLARTLEDLGQKIRFTQAETPSDYEARLEILEQDARQDSEARRHEAYDAGFDTGCRHAMPYNGPLD
jgi:hypothetical protein